jgi:hypothetical protein
MPRTYLISYDLARPTRNKHVLAQEIMSLGERWARPLEQTWYVSASEKASVIEARLATLLDSEDGLLIQQVEDEAVLTNTSLRWFRQRRPGIDIDAESNVLAFPVPNSQPAQCELPFARAS